MKVNYAEPFLCAKLMPASACDDSAPSSIALLRRGYGGYLNRSIHATRIA